MNRFDEKWAAAVAAVRQELGRREGDPAALDALATLLGGLHFPGQLTMLAAGRGGGGPIGDELLAGAARLAARRPALQAAGLDAATIEHALRGLLIDGRSPAELLGDESMQAAVLEAAAAYLDAHGVAITPAQARTALRLLTSGELFRDIGAATSAIAHFVPRLPLAIARDLSPTSLIVLTRLVPAILLDAPGLAFGAVQQVRDTLLHAGTVGDAPAMLPRTMRVLYDVATIRATAETLRTLIAPDNESFRLALILYARANGVPLDESHLDALHDSVLNVDDPDLGPALSATIQHFVDDGRLAALRNVLPRFQRATRAETGRRELRAAARASAALEPPTHFEGLVFRLRPGCIETPAAIVAQVLGPDWSCAPFSPSTPFDYETEPARTLTVGEGWEAAHQLAAHPAVERAEPRIETSVPDADEARRARSGFGGGADPATQDHKWSPKLVRAFEAWEREPAAGGERFGDGIVVGHPDTGYTDHRELEGRIVPGCDFLDGGDAVDPLDGGLPWLFPGHGTGTASVLASADEPDGEARVTGVAPWARIMPLRVSRSVIHFSFGHVTQAIYYAVDHGCHVISMSLGGPFGFEYLHAAVRYAVERGVIVVAAAGNHVGFVTHPAAYAEVVAVGGCNVQRRPWSGSSHGEAVDVSAPAESVWKAAATRTANVGVEQSSGTSFATASVAGVAALWLAYHGRDRLIARYGASAVPGVFMTIVQATCQAGVDWPTGELGPGIVDAAAVLATPLPVPAPAPRSRAFGPPRLEPLAEIARHFPDLEVSRVRHALGALLGVSDQDLERRLATVGPELLTHLMIDRELRATFRALAQSAGARAFGAADPLATQAKARLRSVASSQLQRF